MKREKSEMLAEKCARALALLEQAQALIDEVLEDPAYAPDALPRGVVPDGVEEYLHDAIGMLSPDPIPAPWDDDYVPPSRPRLRLIAGGAS